MWACYVLLMGFLSIVIMAGVAMITHSPFVFPSIGPTAILFFFHPMAPSASPRHALYGHAIGIACGYASLRLMGLQHAGSAMSAGITPHRLLAVALSLAATAFFMVMLRVAHAPAGATALMVSLGLVTQPLYFLVLEIAVAMLCVQAIVINRLFGLPYPLWVERVDTEIEKVSPPPKSPLAPEERKKVMRSDS